MLLWFEVIHKLKLSLPFVINSYSVISIFSGFNLVMSSRANQRVQECVTCTGMTFWGLTRCSRKWFFVFLSCCYVSFSVLGCFFCRTYRKKTVWKKSIHCCSLRTSWWHLSESWLSRSFYNFTSLALQAWSEHKPRWTYFAAVDFVYQAFTTVGKSIYAKLRWSSSITLQAYLSPKCNKQLFSGWGVCDIAKTESNDYLIINWTKKHGSHVFASSLSSSNTTRKLDTISL